MAFLKAKEFYSSFPDEPWCRRGLFKIFNEQMKYIISFNYHSYENMSEITSTCIRILVFNV